MVLGLLPSRADVGGPTLNDVHQLLIKAAGDAGDPPAADQQKAFVNQALVLMNKNPLIYYPNTMRIKRELQTIVDDLSTGGSNHQARGDILDADDKVRSLMGE